MSEARISYLGNEEDSYLLLGICLRVFEILRSEGLDKPGATVYQFFRCICFQCCVGMGEGRKGQEYLTLVNNSRRDRLKC